MDLLVIRHAIAEERADFARTGEPDDHRPLTDDGRRKMTLAARGLRRVLPAIDVLAASPLVRAAQTAAIVADTYGISRTTTLEELVPEANPAALLPWLRDQHRARTLGVVGHEPHLGELISFLLSGQPSSFIALKKGSASLLSFGGKPDAGAATLQWLLTPAQLRRLAD